jgi:hypothetical protein
VALLVSDTGDNSIQELQTVLRRRRSSYTVHTRLRHNERLAIESSQQTGFGDCQEPLLQKGTKRTLSVPSLLRMDGTGEERDERATSAVMPAPVGNAAEGKEKLKVHAAKQCGTSSCTDTMHTCRQGAVCQHEWGSMHIHRHGQGKLVPHHKQAAATHNHHCPN